MFNIASTGSGGGVYASSSVMILNKAEFTGNHGAWGGGWLSSNRSRNTTLLESLEGLKTERYFTSCPIRIPPILQVESSEYA